MSNPTACTKPDCSGPEQVAGPAELEVLERHAVAGAELGVVLEHLQPALGVGIDGVGNHQIAVRTAVRPADATAQLVQLRQTERVGAVHEHRVRVRHVEAGLDDHRRDEHVDVAGDEAVHDVLEIALAHLPVAHGNAGARNDAANAVRDRLDGLDAVVHEEHLAAAIELARDAFLDQRLVPRLDEREHRRAVARRGLHERHVAQAGERQMQRARNRGRGERQHVGLEPQVA